MDRPGGGFGRAAGSGGHDRFRSADFFHRSAHPGRGCWVFIVCDRKPSTTPCGARVVGRNARLGGTRDERIARIASRQRGRVARRQLLAAGLGSSQITGLVRRGQLRPRRRGVYAVGHEAPIELAAETEALLAIAPGAALSHVHRGAAVGHARAGRGEPPTPARRSTSPRSRTPACPDHVHRRPGLTARDVRIRQGLTADLTRLDVARPGRQLRGRGPSSGRSITLLVEHRMHPSELRALLDRVPTIAGRRRLVRLLDREHGPAVTRSEAEERMLALVRGADLPEPQVNARRHGWEIDFFWPDARLAVEIDGFRFHSTRRSVQARPAQGRGARPPAASPSSASPGTSSSTRRWRWSHGSAPCSPRRTAIRRRGRRRRGGGSAGGGRCAGRRAADEPATAGGDAGGAAPERRQLTRRRRAWATAPRASRSSRAGRAAAARCRSRRSVRTSPKVSPTRSP